MTKHNTIEGKISEQALKVTIDYKVSEQALKVTGVF